MTSKTLYAPTLTQAAPIRPPGDVRPGGGLVERGADDIAEAACQLAEAGGMHGWTPAAATMR